MVAVLPVVAEREGFEPKGLLADWPGPSRHHVSGCPSMCEVIGCRSLRLRHGVFLNRETAPCGAVSLLWRRGRDLNPRVSSQTGPDLHGTTFRGVTSMCEVIGCRRLMLRRGVFLNRETAPCGAVSLLWRRGRDLNPRGGSTPPTRLAGERLRPLGHLSGCRKPIRGLIEPPTPGDLTSYPVRTRRSMSCRCPREYTIYIGC